MESGGRGLMGYFIPAQQGVHVEFCSAVHDKDHEAFLSTLGSKPELALYQRIYEGPGFRKYLQRSLSTAGQQGALLRFQLRSDNSMLRQHDSRLGISAAMTQRTAYAQLAESQTV